MKHRVASVATKNSGSCCPSRRMTFGEAWAVLASELGTTGLLSFLTMVTLGIWVQGGGRGRRGQNATMCPHSISEPGEVGDRTELHSFLHILFPGGESPISSQSQAGVAGRMTFIGSMTCLGLTTPWPPQVAGGGGRDSIRKGGVEPRLWGLAGWSGREPRQVQAEAQQRYYYSWSVNTLGRGRHLGGPRARRHLEAGRARGHVQRDRAGPGPGFGRHSGECWGGAGRGGPSPRRLW